MRTLAEIARQLANGGKSRALVEECLARIADPAGEGARTFLKVHAETALAAADAHDRARAHGAAASPYAGIPVSLKDLFDVAGDVTTAGSIALRTPRRRARDAPCVARLRAAGFIPIGRTNMTEFAYLGPRHQSALRHAAQSVGPQGRRASPAARRRARRFR